MTKRECGRWKMEKGDAGKGERKGGASPGKNDGEGKIMAGRCGTCLLYTSRHLKRPARATKKQDTTANNSISRKKTMTQGEVSLLTCQLDFFLRGERSKGIPRKADDPKIEGGVDT